MAIEVFNILNGMCPRVFRLSCTKKVEYLQATTIHTSTYGKRSLRNAIPVLWNSLPDENVKKMIN